MRFATLRLEADGKVELAISELPASDILANVNRWRDQLKLDPVHENALSRLGEVVEIGGGKRAFVLATKPVVDSYAFETILVDHFRTAVSKASAFVDLHVEAALGAVSSAIGGAIADPKRIQGDLNHTPLGDRFAISIRAVLVMWGCAGRPPTGRRRMASKWQRSVHLAKCRSRC